MFKLGLIRWLLLVSIMTLVTAGISTRAPTAHAATSAPPVTISSSQGTFYANLNNSGIFHPSVLSSPIFSQQLPQNLNNPSTQAGSGNRFTNNLLASHVMGTVASNFVHAANNTPASAQTAAAGGATLTWNGSVSNDWNTAANWTPASVPQATDDVIIAVASTEPSLTSAVMVNNVTIASGASLTTYGQALTVSGTLTNNGLLETVNDTTSSISGTLTNNGTLRIQAGACCGHLSFSATLTVSGTLTNTSSGTIELTEQGCCNNNGVAGSAELDVSGTLANSGTINALPGQQQDGGRVLLVNALSGTITDIGSPLTLAPYSGTALTSSATVTAQGAPVTVNLPSGGSFTNTGTLAANNGYPITVNGGTFVPSSGATIGDVELDGVALAPGTIASGSSLRLTVSSTVPGPLVNNGTLTLAGSTVAGSLTNTGLILVTSGTTNTFGGPLTNSGTLRIRAGDCGVGAAPAVSGTLTNTSAGTIELTQTGADCLSAPGAASLFVTGTLINDGTISALHGDNGGDRILLGTISNQSGGAITTVGVDLTLSNATFTNNGTVSVDTGHALIISGAVTLAGSGAYQANVVNSGQLTVGAPVGSFNVTGKYQQGAGATLNLALGGTASGSFSQLTFSGPAALAGTLNTTFVNGFVPALGGSFQVLTASSVSGTFASITAPTGFTLSGTYGTSSVTIAETAGPPTKMSIMPSSGGDTGTVTVEIVLSGPVASGATVKLSRSGYPDIPGSNVNLGPGGLSLTATFNLIGQADGAWDVVVTNSNGATSTLPSGFTVEQGGAAQVSLSIVGRVQIRVGTPQTYYLVVTNHGNVDAVGVPIWVQVPSNVELSIGFNLTPDTGVLTAATGPSTQSQPTIPYQVTVGNSTIAGFYKPYLPAGSTAVLPITLIVNSITAAFQWNAWVFAPFLANATGIFVAKNPTDAVKCTVDLVSLILTKGFGVRGVLLSSLTSLLNFSVSTPNLADVQMSMWQIFADIANADGLPVFSAQDVAQLSGFSDLLGIVGTVTDCAPFVKILFQTLTDQPVIARDPNDKVGAQGFGAAHFLSGAQVLPYSIYFDNQPTASAPAQTVTVTDSLDANLDLGTVALGPISIPGQLIVPPSLPLQENPFTTIVDLRPTTNLLVKITVSLNISTRTVTWTLQSLDPATNQPPTDPLVGFLPPGTEASVFLTVMPASTVATGTVISNSATVVFDANPPISTPTWSNTIDNTEPTSHVLPLAPTQTSNSFPVQWSGTDAGSGIRDFTIFVSENGGPFTVWQANTTATSAIFTGKFGSTYGFYSVARDNVGNVESAKTAAEVTTTVLDNDLALTNVPANITVNATSPQGAVVTYTAPTVVDEDSPLPAVICDHASGSTFAIGTTTVTCTATDSDDTTSPANASFTVTVLDTDLALTTVPATITVNATSASGAVVTYTPPTVVDEDSTKPTVSCTPASGSTFPIGTTTVTCTVSDQDDSPNSVSVSFQVVVKGPVPTGAQGMAFWGAKTGQAIISNGAATNGVCNVGTWLRQYAPFQGLIATATCSKVASYVATVLNVASNGTSVAAVLKGQMLATALDVYFSDPALGGNKLNAPAPIGGVTIDLTYICTAPTTTSGGAPTCGSGTYENTSSAFGGSTSLTLLQMLSYVSSQFQVSTGIWYGGDQTKTGYARDAFACINIQWAFAP